MKFNIEDDSRCLNPRGTVFGSRIGSSLPARVGIASLHRLHFDDREDIKTKGMHLVKIVKFIVQQTDLVGSFVVDVG